MFCGVYDLIDGAEFIYYPTFLLCRITVNVTPLISGPHDGEYHIFSFHLQPVFLVHISMEPLVYNTIVRPKAEFSHIYTAYIHNLTRQRVHIDLIFTQ